MKAGPTHIAVAHGADGETIQELFAALAAELRASGRKVAGIIAEAHTLPARTCSAGMLHDIASGRRFPIYLETAPSGTSCHLDAGGVEAACSALLGQIKESDLVVLSKFGKLEAMRGGLFPAFEAAVAAGKPILTSVSEKHSQAWRIFAPHADRLAADKAALMQWWRARAG